MAEGAVLVWIHSTPKAGISDYTIVEPKEVRRVLELLQSYVRLKQEHVRLGLQILDEIPRAVDAVKLVSLCQLVDRFRNINYSKKSHGYLAPVETDP